MVSIRACHARDRGSIPREGVKRRGAEEACSAHNRKDIGSKPIAAITGDTPVNPLLYSFFSSYHNPYEGVSPVSAIKLP